MVLRLLRLLGAPRNSADNMAWQRRHPARVAFALATLLSGIAAAFILASTQHLRGAILFFAGGSATLFVFFYAAARINIARGRTP